MKLILAINLFFYKSNKFFVLFALICANFYNKRRNYATDMAFFSDLRVMPPVAGMLGGQREHGNLILRHSILIKTLPFPTFHRLLEALCVDWRNTTPDNNKIIKRSKEIKIFKKFYSLHHDGHDLVFSNLVY